MWECTCGFANDASARTCPACGANAPAAETPGSLVLVDVRTGARIEIASPGGIVGRAGDFSPDLFSQRVSGVHLVAECRSGTWTLEFVGRNPTALNAAGTWMPLEAGLPREVRGGELLKMADMLFSVEVAPEPASEPKPEAQDIVPEEGGACASGFEAAGETCGEILDDSPENDGENYGEEYEEEPAPRIVGWAVRCPVCGVEYPVADESARMDTCPSCFDPLDARRIARTAASPIYR